MFFTLKKNDIIRIVFGILTANCIWGVINGTRCVIPIKTQVDLIRDNKLSYLVSHLPSVISISTIIIDLTALVLFGIFLYKFSYQYKNLITIALILIGLSSLTLFISYVLSYSYSNNVFDVLKDRLFIFIVISIMHLILVVLFTILAIKSGGSTKSIKVFIIITIVCSLLLSIFTLIYVVLDNRLKDLNIFRSIIIQFLELTIIPLFLMITPRLDKIEQK